MTLPVLIVGLEVVHHSRNGAESWGEKSFKKLASMTMALTVPRVKESRDEIVYEFHLKGVQTLTMNIQHAANKSLPG